MFTIQKHWWHATTRENWKKIKKEGLRAGAYLSRSISEIDILSKCDVLLSVKYIPDESIDYYLKEVGELTVKKPISVENIKLVTKNGFIA